MLRKRGSDSKTFSGRVISGSPNIDMVSSLNIRDQDRNLKDF
jgi:hypothetical protein